MSLLKFVKRSADKVGRSVSVSEDRTVGTLPTFGAEQLLTRLAEFTIVKQFLLTPCFVHREDAKLLCLEKGSSPVFSVHSRIEFNRTEPLPCSVKQRLRPSKISRC
jgi:hypothetical protein